MFFIYCSRHGISELRWPIIAKFCTVVCTRLKFYNWVQKIRGLSSKKFQGPKICKIWHDFEQLNFEIWHDFEQLNFDSEYLKNG